MRLSEVAQRLGREVGRAVGEHQLIEDGDRIMVAVSGGKDSYAMLELLVSLQRRAPVRFELVAVHLDQGQPGYDGAPLRAWLEREGHRFEVLREDTYSVVIDKVPEGKTYCSLCSRLRRGILYTAAERMGCTKIALGHHRDDAIETLMLNLLFAGKIAAMPAKLRTEDQRNTVIRPLIYCAEADLAAYAVERGFPILPCNLCGSQQNAQRKQMKLLLDTLESSHPQVRQSMLAALGNVVPSHLLDRALVTEVSGAKDPTLDGGEDRSDPLTQPQTKRRLPLVVARGD